MPPNLEVRSRAIKFQCYGFGVAADVPAGLRRFGSKWPVLAARDSCSRKACRSNLFKPECNLPPLPPLTPCKNGCPIGKPLAAAPLLQFQDPDPIQARNSTVG